MLIKWLISTLQSSSTLGIIGPESLNAMALQFCHNLKYVGVLKQISNEQQQQQDAPSGFSVSSMHSSV